MNIKRIINYTEDFYTRLESRLKSYYDYSTVNSKPEVLWNGVYGGIPTEIVAELYTEPRTGEVWIKLDAWQQGGKHVTRTQPWFYPDDFRKLLTDISL
jgi:hypothetical protein